MTDNSTSQAHAQMASVRAMVAALDCDYDRLEELRDAREPFVAGWNMAGFMPDNEPSATSDFEDAREYIVTELRERAEACRDEAHEAERAIEFEEAAAFAEKQPGPFSVTAGGYAFWVTEAENNGLECADDAEELAELELAAGDCKDRDEAEERIREDALSVEVRSDWRSLGDEAEDTDFRIVLCTGGPHVQIRGELRNGEPVRAWLEYQDWGTPMAERANQEGDEEALLSYCACFYFGE